MKKNESRRLSNNEENEVREKKPNIFQRFIDLMRLEEFEDDEEEED